MHKPVTIVAGLMLAAGTASAQTGALPLDGLLGLSTDTPPGSSLAGPLSGGAEPLLELVNYTAAVGTGVAAAQPSQPELVAVAESLIALGSNPGASADTDLASLLSVEHFQDSANATIQVVGVVADGASKLTADGVDAYRAIVAGNTNYSDILRPPSLALDQEILIDIPQAGLDALIVAFGGEDGALTPTFEALKVAEFGTIDRARAVFIRDLATPEPDLPRPSDQALLSGASSLPSLPGL
ncbi:hypothetical protein RM531_11020 [Salinisphaera sp. P385]|uniref:DUF1400 domain-containing protein n=1 Tax=Spectribacter acetivorans TaxID=3075603 RepID=A0ABU3BA21_9GAMM|nr:hypothetical protein [Salinisphaera sp. P385]MDT0619008.1 hypothetical protein [Salinisphaera sp. P385]